MKIHLSPAIITRSNTISTPSSRMMRRLHVWSSSPSRATGQRGWYRGGSPCFLATTTTTLPIPTRQPQPLYGRCWSSSSAAITTSPLLHHQAQPNRNSWNNTCTQQHRGLATTSNPSDRPFQKVLIANRGEIALRVMRTCHALGIPTVGVYSTADATAAWAAATNMHQAVCLGPPAADQSYLNVEALLQAVRSTGASAVHPGYGFLSENAAFADAVATQTDATWLGPPGAVIEQMGDKLQSKRLAREAGVNVIPGVTEPLASLQHALKTAHSDEMKSPQSSDSDDAYPILLKAAAGGGGKGMRVCYNDADVRSAYPLAKAEAKKYFADDRLLMEKYIERPRHIELQILAYENDDGHTTTVVFPERDCSLQRRNQKILEESPSVVLTEEQRRVMASQVRLLCETVGYRSAGTMEFLWDDVAKQFYFLEMNTRLQVEHPVTEAVCGNVDLVKAMLWTGAGWGLPPELEQQVFDSDGQLAPIVPHKGHAMEARIYAEDPVRGFLPSTGPLTQYVEPTTNLLLQYGSDELNAATTTTTTTTDRYIRVDSGVSQGTVVSPYYDPLLSKLIALSPTRDESIVDLKGALDEYVLEGVRHNARLVQSVLRQDAFAEGDVTTNFLKLHYKDGFSQVELTEREQQDFAVAAAMIGMLRQDWLDQPPLTGGGVVSGDEDDHDADKKEAEEDASPPPAPLVVRLGGLFGRPFWVTLDEESATVQCLDSSDESGVVRTVQVKEPLRYEPEHYLARVTLDGIARTLQVVGEQTTGELKLQLCGADMLVLIQSPREYQLSAHMKEPVPVDTSHMVLSPMPGTLIRYAVNEGDVVEEGQELCVVEAMKMQNIIRSPRVGAIASCRVPVGSSLQADEVLLEFAA